MAAGALREADIPTADNYMH